GPGGAAHTIENRLGFTSAAESLDQVHAGQRNVEPCAGGILEEHVVALRFALCNFAKSEILSDAMFGVDYVIAGLEIDEVGGESCQVGFGAGRAGNQLGRLE